MENKSDIGDLFTNGENHWGKTPPVNLRLPLSRIHYYKNKWLQVKGIHYYQNKWLQVKGILVPNTNLQLNPYPNTQLDL